MSCEELERFPVFQLYGQGARGLGPRRVDSILRKSRKHFFDSDLAQQLYENDDQESPEEEQERLASVCLRAVARATLVS